MSGHSRASFVALRDAGADLTLVHRAATADAPYDDSRLDLGVETSRWSTEADEAAIRDQVERFAPDTLLVCSWDVGAYRRVSRAMKGRTLRILCMDNSWLGTAKQWGGRLVSPAVIRPSYDVAFLPGERQAVFARRLGFGDDRILWGFYTCDHPLFSAIGGHGRAGLAPAFVFAGRLVAAKGADVLAEAYRRYRSTAADPWPLILCGTGPLAGAFAGLDGVDALGFVQPEEIPAVFARSGCLVLPSRFEPWGVVIHEAASAGLAVVCSTACGASTRLVLDGYNGAVVGVGDPAALAAAMSWVAAAGTDGAALSRRSTELARQFTPARWAEYLLERIPAQRRRLGLDPS